MKKFTFLPPTGIIKGQFAMLATIADTYNFSDEEFESIINMEIGEVITIGGVVIIRNQDVWPKQ